MIGDQLVAVALEARLIAENASDDAVRSLYFTDVAEERRLHGLCAPMNILHP
jgi:hypothetical protein